MLGELTGACWWQAAADAIATATAKAYAAIAATVTTTGEIAGPFLPVICSVPASCDSAALCCS